MQVSNAGLQAIARLWAELGEFPPGHAEAAQRHCFQELAHILGASNVFWVGAVRQDPAAPASDPTRGWRPRGHGVLYTDTRLQRLTLELAQRTETPLIDPLSKALVARCGSSRAFRREELVSDGTWYRSWLYNETMHPFGIEQRMMGVCALGPDVESYIGLDRARGDRPFDSRQRDLLHLFMMGCAGFHHGQLLANGLPEPPLTCREREVLRLLLSDLKEREIAAVLGIGWRTVHQHVVSILRKNGVTTRLSLMARWLGRMPHEAGG